MPEQANALLGASPALAQVFSAAKAGLTAAGNASEKTGSLFSSNLGEAIEQQLAKVGAQALPLPGGTEAIRTTALAGLTGAAGLEDSPDTAGDELLVSAPLIDGDGLLATGSDDTADVLILPDAPDAPDALEPLDVTSVIEKGDTLLRATPDKSLVSGLQNAASESDTSINLIDQLDGGETADSGSEPRQVLQQTEAPAADLTGDTLYEADVSAIDRLPTSSLTEAETSPSLIAQARQGGESAYVAAAPVAPLIDSESGVVAKASPDTLGSLLAVDQMKSAQTGDSTSARLLGQTGPSILQGSNAANVSNVTGLEEVSGEVRLDPVIPGQAGKATALPPVQPDDTQVKKLLASNETVLNTAAPVRDTPLTLEAVNKEAVSSAEARAQSAELSGTRFPTAQTAEQVQTVASRLLAHRMGTGSISGSGQSSGELPLSDMPANVADVETLMASPDMKTTVQQRLAATEALLSQMSMDTTDSVAGKAVPDASTGAMPLNSLTTATAPRLEAMTSPLTQAPFNLALDSDDADTALMGNVKWMANEGVKNAVVTVTPNGMGPISIKVGIEGDQMDVSIMASQHTTREALESMLPRLREQLAVQGHESVKVDVSDGKGDQSRSGNGQAFADSRGSADSRSFSGTGSQDSQSNSSNHQENAEYGRSSESDRAPDSVMAEDLQRVAARVVGENHDRPVFDAYV